MPLLKTPQFQPAMDLREIIENDLIQLLDQTQHSDRRTELYRDLPEESEGWLYSHFSAYLTKASGDFVPFAEHHTEFWKWIWSIRPGQRLPASFWIWARGGGKSTSMEIAVAAMGYFGLRRYVMYCSETQKQADDHILAIANLFSELGIERSLNRYGYAQGWSANRLLTADGFTVIGFGLDVPRRGVKRDEVRPDCLVLDDVDNEKDKVAATEKKINTITRSLLPALSTSGIVIGVQNIPNRGGIFDQIARNEADFLRDRMVSGPHKAIDDFEYEQYETEDGHVRYRITNGTPTWEGFDLSDAESLLNNIGLVAFEVEFQHRTELRTDSIIKEWWLRYWHYPGMTVSPVRVELENGQFIEIESVPLPSLFHSAVQSWDMAFKDTSTSSYVVGGVWLQRYGDFFLRDLYRQRADFTTTLEAVRAFTRKWPMANRKLIEDKANGTAIINTLRRDIPGIVPVTPQGSKDSRIAAVSPLFESANVFVPHPSVATWSRAYIHELCTFRGELGAIPGEQDDQVDMTSQALLSFTQSGTIGSIPFRGL